MDYKIVILAAGIGSRMGAFTQYLNKALIPVQGKPAICHIIDKIPKNIEVVIAVGYLKEGLQIYLGSAYPDRKITFVDVDKYTGTGSGPGYSLLCCKEQLQCPFVFFSVDTLVKENIPVPDHNWYGVAEVPDTTRFCSAKVEGTKIVRLDDKIKCDNKHAFIGLAGVFDYKVFWRSLENNKTIIGGEIQVSNGFSSLVEQGMYIKTFTWFDTGAVTSYDHARKYYPEGPSYQGE